MDKMIKFENGLIVINQDEVRVHLVTTIPEPSDESDETRMDTNDAARCLEEVRRLFYGTPLEHVISELIGVCSTVTEYLEVDVTEFSEKSDDDFDGENTDD